MEFILSYFACAFSSFSLRRRRSPLFRHPSTRRARPLRLLIAAVRFSILFAALFYTSRARFVASRFSIVRRAPKLENSEIFALSVAKVRHRHKDRSELFGNIFREREELLSRCFCGELNRFSDRILFSRENRRNNAIYWPIRLIGSAFYSY